MPVPKFILQVRMPLKYHERAFPFQIPHKTGNTYIWRDFHRHVDMVSAHFRFYYMHAFPFAQCA